MKEESRKILDELIREHSSRYARPSGLSDTVFELKDFNYTRKSKKYRFLKKNAKQKGFDYVKRIYLPTKDIKSQIDKMGE